MDKYHRVFFSPIEIAGQMGYMVRGLKEREHHAVGFNTYRTYLNYNSPVIDADLPEVLEHYEREKHNCDIFHYFYNISLKPDFSDLRELRSMGKTAIMHFWGNDVRVTSLSAKLSPFLTDPCNPLPDNKIEEHLRIVGSLIDTAIVQDFEVYPYIKDYFRNIYVLPLLFDVTGIEPSYPALSVTDPLIIHAPTQPVFKGTAIIEQTLEQLRKDGFRFRFRKIERMSNAEALEAYREADIVIDQILVGSHGTLAVEAMALGKPVVSYIREDLAPLFPANLPIVNASPVALHRQLIPLITDSRLRHETGMRSRAYAEQHHDIPKVVDQLLAIYNVATAT